MHTNVGGSSDNRLLIDRVGRVGIGTVAPNWPMDIVANVEGWNQPILSITNLGNDTARYLAKAYMDNPGGFFAFSSSGPPNAPAPTRGETNMLIVSACGYDGVEYTAPMAEIGLSAAEDFPRQEREHR